MNWLRRGVSNHQLITSNSKDSRTHCRVLTAAKLTEYFCASWFFGFTNCRRIRCVPYGETCSNCSNHQHNRLTAEGKTNWMHIKDAACLTNWQMANTGKPASKSARFKQNIKWKWCSCSCSLRFLCSNIALPQNLWCQEFSWYKAAKVYLQRIDKLLTFWAVALIVVKDTN